MNAHIRTRGIAGVFANADPNAILAQLNSAFEDFRARQSGRVDNLEAAIDALNSDLTAARLGGGGGGPLDHASRAAFADFLRTGMPQAGMRESSDPDGGYAVPKKIDQTIQHQLLDFSPLRQWATIITLGQGAGTYSFLVNRRGAGSGWVGEEEARPETDSPQLANITPPEGEIYANASITQWLLDDSGFDLDQFIRDNIIDEMAVQEGAAFVAGSGVNKPRGFLTYDTSADDDAVRSFGRLQDLPTGVGDNRCQSTQN